MITAEHRYRQMRRRQSIVQARRLREFIAGRTNVLIGCRDEDAMIDALRRAYEAGVRDAGGRA